MPTPALSAEKEAQIKELLARGTKRDRISEIVGCSHGVVDRIKRGGEMRTEAKAEPVQSESSEMTADSWKISIPKTRICTEAQLVEHCKIDLQIWEIDKLVINKWDVGAKVGPPGAEVLTTEELFQVKAYLKKKVAVANAIAEIELLRKEALKYSPKFTGFKPRKPAGSGVAAEMFNTDHHTGAEIDGDETGWASWGMKLADEAWRDSFSTLCSRVDGYTPDVAVLPMGSDQMNFDTAAGTTTNLTPQTMAARYYRVYEQVKKNSRFAIDMALQKYGRVRVPIVPGNHDQLTAWHLGDYLTTWYRNCPGVTIDNSPQLRKWWEYGVVMVMWEHGNKGKVPDYGKIMAAKMPEMWGRTKWREAHTAHVHTRRVFEDTGYTVRGFASLRPSCAWGVENHHEGTIQASEALAWSKTEGLIGQATYSILRKGEA